MEIGEYEKLFAIEDTHWWFKGIRLYFAQTLKNSNHCDSESVLDIGCGTGANMRLLRGIFGEVTGLDLSKKAISFCRKRGLDRTIVADIDFIPFRNETFDCVLCSDVFECKEVDEKLGFSEIVRVTKRRGRIILSVAAYQFLLSEHDRAVHSVRRYTKTLAKQAFSVDGVEIINMRYLFGIFFSVIVMYRLIKNLRRRKRDAPPCSDVFLLPDLLNNILYYGVKIEQMLSTVRSLPFGSTLMIEMRRL